MSPIYDDNGSLLSYNGKVYTWNEENRLRTVQNGGQTAEFVYNAEGKRVVYLRNGQETRYLYDGWNVLGEYNGSNNLKKAYLWGTDLSSSEQGAGGVGGLLACRDVSQNSVADDTGNGAGASFYYHYDGNGNVTKLTDAIGNVSASYDYSPFGKVIAQSGDYADENKHRFSTKPYEKVLGCYYYGFRFYDAGVGRWLSRDQVGETEDLSLYNFIGNNSFYYYDYLGNGKQGYRYRYRHTSPQNNRRRPKNKPDKGKKPKPPIYEPPPREYVPPPVPRSSQAFEAMKEIVGKQMKKKKRGYRNRRSYEKARKDGIYECYSQIDKDDKCTYCCEMQICKISIGFDYAPYYLYKLNYAGVTKGTCSEVEKNRSETPPGSGTASAACDPGEYGQNPVDPLRPPPFNTRNK